MNKRGRFASELIDRATSAQSEPPSMSAVVTGGPGTINSASGPFLLWSGYSAANTSPARGYVYWPQAKTRFELDSLSAEEIRRRVHWLLGNFGFARRLVWGAAETAGNVTPFADTGVDEWDELVEENFLDRVTSPEIFDAAGKYDFWTVQNQLDVNAFKDGDCLCVPTSPEGWDGLQLAIYEGTQITHFGSWQAAWKPAQAQEWIDGVKTDDWGKHLAYRMQHGNDPGNYIELPADSAYYYGNLENHHGVRGISLLASVVVNMIDVVETRGYIKKRIKESATIAPVIETAAPTVLAAGGGLGGQLIQQSVQMPDDTTREINWEVMLGGGQMPNLAPGQKINMVSDDRPTPSNQSFEQALMEDCSHAANLPHEALFSMRDLSGPSTRYVLQRLERWIANRFRHKARWVRWYRALWLANEIASGRIPQPREIPGKPGWWLKAAYVGQTAMTIDEGRRGNLALINLQSGQTTWAREWGALGQYWKRGIRQRVLEIEFAKEEAAKHNLSLAEVFPKLAAPEPNAAPGDQPREDTA